MFLPSRLFVVPALLALAACHPLSCFHPPELPRDKPLEVTSSSERFPAAELEVLVDDWGIPHVFGSNEGDLSYGLGYMHGRDRQFQLMFRKFAALGRLSELFDREDLLSADRYLRLLSWRLDEQLAATSERSLQILEGYAAGINDGAKAAGRSAEMALLGLDFEDFTARDVLACVRLLQDDQNVGRSDELARARVMSRLAHDHPVRAELLAPVGNRDLPIVAMNEHTGLFNFEQSASAQEAGSLEHIADPRGTFKRQDKPRAAGKRPDHEQLESILRGLWPDVEGASNSWAVSGERTASGNAVLVNDPHLSHEAPALFYLTHLKSDDIDVTGVTFPGIPAVLIGYGRHMAWGITNAYADCQDLVRIAPVQEREDLYWLDGAPMSYGLVEQRYKTGRGEDAGEFVEQWRTTVFGPLMPPGRAFQHDEGDLFAIQDCMLRDFADKPDLVGSLWDIPMSETAEDIDAAAQQFAAPFMSLLLAFTDGNIGWRMSGQVPIRRSSEPVHLPRDGRTRQAGWRGTLPPEYKPQAFAPEKGWLIAANQHITEPGGPGERYFGYEGSDGYRAKRIEELLVPLLEEGKPNAEQLLSLQQDIESLQARLLAPVLAASCPKSVPEHPEERVEAMCDALAGFDAKYPLESKGALVFEWLAPAVRLAIATAHLGEEAAGQVAGTSFFQLAYERALLAFAEGEQPALLDHPDTGGYDGLAPFVEGAAREVLDRLVAEIGEDPDEWTWGRVHWLSFRGRLAEAPAVGFLFDTDRYPQTGCSTCVRSERNTPVNGGSGLRFVVEMSDPPKGRMVIDSGQSGHYGHKHFEDQQPRWNDGEPIDIPRERSRIEEVREGWLKVKPKG